MVYSDVVDKKEEWLGGGDIGCLEGGSVVSSIDSFIQWSTIIIITLLFHSH